MKCMYNNALHYSQSLHTYSTVCVYVCVRACLCVCVCVYWYVPEISIDVSSLAHDLRCAGEILFLFRSIACMLNTAGPS